MEELESRLPDSILSYPGDSRYRTKPNIYIDFIVFDLDKIYYSFPFKPSRYLSSLHFGDPDVIFLSPTDYNLSLADVPEIGFNRVPAFFTPNHHSRVSSNFES